MNYAMLGWILFACTLSFMIGMGLTIYIGHKYNMRKKADGG